MDSQQLCQVSLVISNYNMKHSHVLLYRLQVRAGYIHWVHFMEGGAGWLYGAATGKIDKSETMKSTEQSTKHLKSP